MLKDLCFEITQKCPNECKFCSSNSSLNAQNEISLQTFKNTVNHFYNNGGIAEISISGGEPFLHPDLFEMIKFCKEKDIRTVLFTSGLKKGKKLSTLEVSNALLERDVTIKKLKENEPENERAIKNVYKFYENITRFKGVESLSDSDIKNLEQLGLDKIVFDWQAFEEETDNNVMGRRNQITILFKSMIKASNSKLDVDIHFIPMKPNYKQILDIVECLNICKIKNLSILKFVPQGRGKENSKDLMLNSAEMDEFKSLLNKAKSIFKGTIRVGVPLNKDLEHECTAGKDKIDIRYDGVALPCPAFKNMKPEVLKAHGIQLYNIYEDLNEIKLENGKRDEPLCNKIYNKEDSER